MLRRAGVGVGPDSRGEGEEEASCETAPVGGPSGTSDIPAGWDGAVPAGWDGLVQTLPARGGATVGVPLEPAG